MAAAMPPSAMTVWAFPSSDLQTTPTRSALRERLKGARSLPRRLQ